MISHPCTLLSKISTYKYFANETILERCWLVKAIVHPNIVIQGLTISITIHFGGKVNPFSSSSTMASVSSRSTNLAYSLTNLN